MSPAAWGGGANSEAKLLMIDHAFERLGCARVEFKTDALNERARAALAALPSQFEGIFRKHMLMYGGRWRDSAWYAITDEDWPERDGSCGRGWSVSCRDARTADREDQMMERQRYSTEHRMGGAIRVLARDPGGTARARGGHPRRRARRDPPDGAYAQCVAALERIARRA